MFYQLSIFFVEGVNNTFIGQIQAIITLLKDVATIAGIIIGAIWTYRLFILKREKFEKVNILHQAKSYDLWNHSTLISVEIKIENTGDVIIEIGKITVKLLQINPLIKPLQVCLENGQNLGDYLLKNVSQGQEAWPNERLAWPEIGYINSSGSHIIEPGNSQKLLFDFIIHDSVRGFRVETSFENKRLKVNPYLKKRLFKKRLKQKYYWNNISNHFINDKNGKG